MKFMGVFQECWHLCPYRPLLHAQGLLNKLFFSFSDPGFVYFAQNTRK